MPSEYPLRGWQRLFFNRKQSLKMTWKLRIAVIAITTTLTYSTSGLWTTWIAQSLVQRDAVGVSDIILIDNLEVDYLLFERAAELKQSGLANRVLVPFLSSADSLKPSVVSRRIAEVMAQVARLDGFEMFPIREIEPVSLNAARQVRSYVVKDGLKSMILVTSGFRSKRSFLVYRSMFEDAGVKIYCLPVFGLNTPKTWTRTWHSIQEVVLQFLKLQYYRLWVLPFLSYSES